MPLPIGVSYTAGDTILTLGISESPQHFEFVLPQEPLSITVDPEYWIIQKNTVTPVYEAVSGTVRPAGAIQTIGRAISLELDDHQLVRIFDVTGRRVYRTEAKRVLYRPSKAGIYFIMIGDRRHKVVVVN
jgi:hypothetical protein